MQYVSHRITFAQHFSSQRLPVAPANVSTAECLLHDCLSQDHPSAPGPRRSALATLLWKGSQGCQFSSISSRGERPGCPGQSQHRTRSSCLAFGCSLLSTTQGQPIGGFNPAGLAYWNDRERDIFLEILLLCRETTAIDFTCRVFRSYSDGEQHKT